MLNWLSKFTLNNANVAVCILFACVVLYECKFGEPITFFWGKPKLFEGTVKQKIYSWILFIVIIINFLRNV